MKAKYIDWKLTLIEKEIKRLEEMERHVNVNLRQAKEKQWVLIEQLEKLEGK